MATARPVKLRVPGLLFTATLAVTYRDYLRDDIVKWRKVVAAAKLPLQ